MSVGHGLPTEALDVTETGPPPLKLRWATFASIRKRRLVRKGGLEPPRYCYRQPLKLANLVCCSGLMRILRTDPEQQRTAVHASDDSIRTHSHTAREVLWAGRTIDGRDSPPRSSTGLSCVRRIADSVVPACQLGAQTAPRAGPEPAPLMFRGISRQSLMAHRWRSRTSRSFSICGTDGRTGDAA
jgi:hypothetical protein